MTSFAIGDRVCLRYAPTGTPGTIIGLKHGKAEVQWEDLAVSTKHALGALLPSEVTA